MGFDYDRMTTSELTNTLLAADQRDAIRREALSALTRRGRVVRNSRLALAIQYVLRYPDRYDQGIMEEALDVLATDPHPDATSVMVELLEDITTSVLDADKTASFTFRKYFYQVLMSRQREEDLGVWHEYLPSVQAKTLVGLISDPASDGIVDGLEPFVLLNRQPEPGRTKALFYTISSVARLGSAEVNLEKACELLNKTHDDESFHQGKRILRRQLSDARRKGAKEEARALSNALKKL